MKLEKNIGLRVGDEEMKLETTMGLGVVGAMLRKHPKEQIQKKFDDYKKFTIKMDLLGYIPNAFLFEKVEKRYNKYMENLE